MRRNYSRLIATEEKKNLRNAFILIILTLVVVLGLFFFGIPTVVKFAAFITDIKKVNTPIDKSDITPPAPPRFNTLPDTTNNEDLEITGNTEAGAKVTLLFNDESSDVIAGVDGNFTFRVKLTKGENTVSAVAQDQAGNNSQSSQVNKIILDKDELTIVVNQPKDGENFYGSKQKQITIAGSTKSGANLSINDRWVRILDDGTFSFTTILTEGDNGFTLKATDQAGNSTEKSILVKYTE